MFNTYTCEGFHRGGGVEYIGLLCSTPTHVRVFIGGGGGRIYRFVVFNTYTCEGFHRGGGG